MGTMITSGVQMMDCLNIVREVAENVYYQEMWEDVRNKVQNGAQLSEPLLRSGLVPKSVAQMIQYWIGVLPIANTTWAQYTEVFLRFR